MPRTIARARGNLADMLTPTLLRDAIGEVVSDHQASLSFRSWWTPEKDREHEPPYTVCVWLPPEMRVQRSGTSNAFTIGYVVNMELVDRVGPERSTDDRDAVHAKMGMYAVQLFMEVVKRYVTGSTVVNNERINLRIAEPMTTSNFADDAPAGETGITMRFVVTSEDAIDCTSVNQAFP